MDREVRRRQICLSMSELTQARRIMRTFDVIVIGLGGMGSVIGEVVREMFLSDKTTLDIWHKEVRQEWIMSYRSQASPRS